MKRAAGFTMIELVVVIVILGVLAAVAIPRMDTSGYRAMEFHDKTVSALRYAQKTAPSHRRLVCVTFPDDHTLALNVDTNKDAVCETALLVPGAQNNQVVSGDPVQAKFSSTPAVLNFAADGTSSSPTIKIQGANDIIVYGTTGLVQ